MTRSFAQPQTGPWGRTGIVAAMLAIALLAWGASPRLSADEAGINVDLFAVTSGADYVALTAGVEDAPFAVAMRIDAAPEASTPAQWAEGVEASLNETFESFTAFHMASETLFTAFFGAEEELVAIAEAIEPAFAQSANTTVSVRTDPESNPQIN